MGSSLSVHELTYLLNLFQSGLFEGTERFFFNLATEQLSLVIPSLYCLVSVGEIETVYVNKTDQPAHPCSMICISLINCLDYYNTFSCCIQNLETLLPAFGSKQTSLSVKWLQTWY